MATRFNPDNSYHDEVGLAELLKRFGQDGAALVRQEIALAKLEVKEAAKGYVADAAKMGAAIGVAFFGMLALVAFLVIGLGDLLNNYWLGALIVAVVFLAVAGIMAKGAKAHMARNSLAPTQTVQALKEDQRWAQNEVHDLKQKLKA